VLAALPFYDGQITVGGSSANLITFTIDGISYQAEDGMTWEEWVYSSYNTGGWSVTGGTIWNSRETITYNGVKVAPTDVIIEATYGVVSQGASPD
jgi:hypothetical protein